MIAKTEFDLMQKIRHKNFLKVLDFSVDSPLSVYMVVEKMKASLHDELFPNCKISPELKDTIMLETSLGLEYLHKKSYIHGNFNPHHILLPIDKKSPPKICDFKCMRRTTEDVEQMAGQETEIPRSRDARWLAPEVVKSDGDVKPTVFSDIFSYCATMAELFSETAFFRTDDSGDCMKQVKFFHTHKHVPDALKNLGGAELSKYYHFVSRGLNHDAHSRSSMSELAKLAKHLKQ